MLWSAGCLLSTGLLTTAQCSEWSQFDPKPTSGRAPLRNGSGGKRPPITAVGRCAFPAELGPLTGPGRPTKDQSQIHVAPRDGISGFGGGGRRRSTSRIPSSEIQAINQN